MKWRIGRGDQVLFWQDKWLDENTLSHYNTDRNNHDMNCTISSFFKNDWWDIDKLRSVVPENIAQKIVSTPVDFTGQVADTQIWGATPDGSFTVNSAYKLQFNGPNWPDSCWDFVWKLKVPPKMRYFFSLVVQGKILSNEQRARRNLNDDPSCGSCGWINESVIHILRDCAKTRAVWGAFLDPHQTSTFFLMDFHPWLKLNLMAKHNTGSGFPWYLVFMFICWFIWKWRNQRVFYVEFEMPATPKTPILLAVREWHGAVQEALKPKLRAQVMLTWIPPETGHYKLNVDGARKIASGAIGAGGLIRDCTGDWIRGFAVNLGEGQILDAEIWALYFGLKLAVDLGLTNLLIEMDSATAVNLLHKPTLLDYHPLAALIRSCNELIAQIGGCSIHHIYRERNHAVDAIANWSYNLALGGCLLVEAPSWLENILLDDILGVATPRMIPAAA